MHHVQEKVVHLIFGHNFCKVYRFSKFFHWQIHKETAYVPVIEISTSPQLLCYTTLWNLKIQNNCWTNISARKKHLFYWKLSKT